MRYTVPNRVPIDIYIFVNHCYRCVSLGCLVLPVNAWFASRQPKLRGTFGQKLNYDCFQRLGIIFSSRLLVAYLVVGVDRMPRRHCNRDVSVQQLTVWMPGNETLNHLLCPVLQLPQTACHLVTSPFPGTSNLENPDWCSP